MQSNENIQGDYKWCERLHKFIGKKVISTQKLHSRHYACVQKSLYEGMTLLFVQAITFFTNKYILSLTSFVITLYLCTLQCVWKWQLSVAAIKPFTMQLRARGRTSRHVTMHTVQEAVTL
jgi:hypothetical protein